MVNRRTDFTYPCISRNRENAASYTLFGKNRFRSFVECLNDECLKHNGSNTIGQQGSNNTESLSRQVQKSYNLEKLNIITIHKYK